MKNIQHPKFAIQRRVKTDVCQHWLWGGGCGMLDVPKLVFILAVRLYRQILSPAQTFLFGPTGGCRFTPTCSVYAMDALREHGALVGTALAARRICRCHPWGGCGHDPVPAKAAADQDSECGI